MKIALQAWEERAFFYGMTQEEIERQNAFIASAVEYVLPFVDYFNFSFYIKRDEEGPARSCEFFIRDKGITVITHLKRKGGLKPLGEGFQAIVKVSLVTFTLNSSLKAGAIIADKVAKRKIDELELEGDFTAMFRGCENIRQVFATVNDRSVKKGILLVGMQCTLRDYFWSRGVLADNEKIAIAKDLCQALIDMRKRGVVHRDIHMGNCSLSYDNRWMLHDFGFACKEQDEISTLTTVKISSPTLLKERVDKKPHRARAVDDAWALGLVLYEMEYACLPDFMDEQRMGPFRLRDEEMMKSAYSLYMEEVDDLIEFLEEDIHVLAPLIVELLQGRDITRALANLKGGGASIGAFSMAPIIDDTGYDISVD